ncbi:hypothetical protein E2C01_047616 [Portunus trituberculatus]|uniref:Uncharacterized protein n=1 Tax=Portunus trituberculatus TaxID=210409 RepID=A0A5B7G9D4_PORTR|nr:hypothetical protein [Portunus trituberculatus]
MRTSKKSSTPRKSRRATDLGIYCDQREIIRQLAGGMVTAMCYYVDLAKQSRERLLHHDYEAVIH